MKGAPALPGSTMPGMAKAMHGRASALLAAFAMIVSLGLASRSSSHVAPCETRADVEARVAKLGERMQGLAAASLLSTRQLGMAIQAVNAADTRYAPAQAYQQHCVALDIVAASLPAAAP